MSATTLTLPDGASGIRISPLTGVTYYNLTTVMSGADQGFKLTDTVDIWLTKQTPTVNMWCTGSYAIQYLTPSAY